MKSNGKRFEENIEASCLKCGIFPIRLKDAGGWNSSSELRFTISNICDFVLATKEGTILVENKSFKGSSFPLSNILGSGENNHKRNMTKVIKLSDADEKYEFLKSFYLILDTESDTVYCIRAYKVLEYIKISTKKSISKPDLLVMSEVLINGIKKRTNSNYDVRQLLGK